MDGRSVPMDTIAQAQRQNQADVMIRRHLVKPSPPPRPSRPSRLPYLNGSISQVSSYAGPATESVGKNALTASFVAGAAAVKCMASFKVRGFGSVRLG